MDNSWVVLYSPDLLRKFRAHMNVELYISKVGSINYLFKYTYKGPDRVTVEMRAVRERHEKCIISKTVPTIDEIKQYQDARYVSASEAAWRLLSFPMVEHQSPVERLEVHLEGHHTIYFESGNEQQAALKREEKPTKLTRWFKAYTNFPSARHIRYANFPTFFSCNKKERKWYPRAKYRIKGSNPTTYDFTLHVAKHVVGRMNNISPK